MLRAQPTKFCTQRSVSLSRIYWVVVSSHSNVSRAPHRPSSSLSGQVRSPRVGSARSNAVGRLGQSCRQTLRTTLAKSYQATTVSLMAMWISDMRVSGTLCIPPTFFMHSLTAMVELQASGRKERSSFLIESHLSLLFTYALGRAKIEFFIAGNVNKKHNHKRPASSASKPAPLNLSNLRLPIFIFDRENAFCVFWRRGTVDDVPPSF